MGRKRKLMTKREINKELKEKQKALKKVNAMIIQEMIDGINRRLQHVYFKQRTS